MDIEIKQTPHELREIVRYIYNVSNEDLSEHFLQKIQENFAGESKVSLEALIKKEYTKIKKSNNKFKKALVLDDKDKEFYFINISKQEDCVAETLTYNLDMDFIRKLYDHLEEYDENFLRKELLLGINGEFEQEVSQKGELFNDLLDKVDILSFIDRLDQIDIKEDVKWRFIQVYKNPQACYMRLAEIIMQNEEAYNNAYKEVSQIVEKFIENLQKAPEKIPSYLKETIGIKLNSNKFIIYPSVSRFHSLTMSQNDGCDILYYGVLFNKLMECSRLIGKGKAPLINILKPLSDKSKFEIIRLLKSEEMYGQQIAEKLKLTTATVSYHMNDLVIANLVCLERRDSKVYYSLNRKAIKEFISELESYML